MSMQNCAAEFSTVQINSAENCKQNSFKIQKYNFKANQKTKILPKNIKSNKLSCHHADKMHKKLKMIIVISVLQNILPFFTYKNNYCKYTVSSTKIDL